jgi:Uma2 family endonuclease
MISTTAPPEIIYPSEDGAPLAETQAHVLAITTALLILREYLNQQAVVFADQFLYYIEGNPRARVAPDLMIIFDIPDQLYNNYKIWETRKVPDVIIEVSSNSTKDIDQVFKKNLYEQIGVGEYWLFDPFGEWIEGQLIGYKLDEEGIYRPISDNISRLLKLKLQPEENLISFYQVDSGKKLLTLSETQSALWSEKQRGDRLAEKLKALGIDPDE